MDFSLGTYINLLSSLQKKCYEIVGFQKYLSSHVDASNNYEIILRHDVDRLPNNALMMAQLENDLGICSTYYFRILPDSFDENIVYKISDLGHEIGYHYEDVDLAVKKQKTSGKAIQNEGELIDIAIGSFEKNLEKFRSIYPVKTICMHGSPMSKYDNRLLWKKYDYRDFGIIGEPYFDVDYNKVLYLTDTGRRWNSSSISIRDKVDTNFNYKFKSTNEIINKIDSLPPKIMFNIHPHRWHDNAYMWSKELILQNAKNVVKYFIAKNVEGKHYE